MPRASRRKPAGPAPPGRPRTVSWFPGHMHKAQQRLAREIQHVDVVVEVRDARLPAGSGNPALARLLEGRPRLLLLNKASLADPAATRAWQQHFAAAGIPTVYLDADSRSGVNLIFPPLRQLAAPLRARFQRRGMRAPPARLMVAGMPNVGKSTLINRIVRQNRLRTAPEPGVTRGITWVHLRKGYLLMDTPGVMLPRIDDEAAALRLGWIGAIRDRVIGPRRLAESLLAWLLAGRFAPAAAHYGIAPAPDAPPTEVLAAIARARRRLGPGGRPDLTSAAELVLQDYRAGRLGRFTLELPEDLASGAAE